MATATARASMIQRLERLWETEPGLAGMLGTVDHKAIGRRYLATAFIFFLLAGLEALVMRTQLITPENSLLSPEGYNQLFSMHGTTMIFLFATPMLSGFGNFFVPLLIGARDMAFPRLNAFSYWVFLLSGIFLYTSFLSGQAPNGGWFAYVPLTSHEYNPGLNMDFWALGIIFLGISTTAGAINFIITIFKLRAPGMSINRMPLFVWNVLVTSFMIVFALPALTSACVLLELDRKVGTHFFDAAAGGRPLLWQHLFWIFGHPDVYIILLPAIGIISEVVPVFSRRPIAGYTFVALTSVATGFLSFAVWAHHMFAVGLSPLADAFFSAASMAVAIPSGIQVFAWLATIWSGRAVWRTPFLFAVGFIILFVIGGVSGVMVGSVPFDWQVTDSYFVVAHFHYVIAGGAAMFPIFAGLHYWLPKVTGRLLDERLGQLTFWLLFIGFNVTFFPMHLVGLLGMPRRIYTYAPDVGWSSLNLIETVGAYLLGLGVLVFLINVFRSLRSGEPAGPDPWGGSSLEWGIASPPPPYNFRLIPVVRSRDPLWREYAWDAWPEPRGDQRGGGQGDGAEPPEAVQEGVTLTRELEQRETLATTLLDAEPGIVLRMPEDSYVPLALALALCVLFAGVLVDSPAVAIAGLLLALGAIGRWLWPAPEEGPPGAPPVEMHMVIE